MSFFKKIFSSEKKATLDKGLEKSKSSFFEKLGKAVAGKSKVDDSVLDNLEEALNISKNEDEIFIIGGSDLYSQTINIANKLYLTSINHEISGDKYFPAFDIDQWKLIDSCSYKKNNSNSHHFKSEIFIKKT